MLVLLRLVSFTRFWMLYESACDIADSEVSFHIFLCSKAVHQSVLAKSKLPESFASCWIIECSRYSDWRVVHCWSLCICMMHSDNIQSSLQQK